MEKPDQKILGIITARGGSKDIPGKNIKELCGKPLIVWTVEAAQQSGVFDRLILSTDDEKIAAVAREYGVEIPFMRPAELAQDTTPHLPVIQHAVAWLREHQKYEPDYAAILQPTAPLRRPEHIREAYAMLRSRGADSVVSVSPIPGHHHPLWAVRIGGGDLASLFVSGESLVRRIPRRQDLPPAYANNGAVYIFRTALLFRPEDPGFYGQRSVAYVMKEEDSINIDDPEDWTRAEAEFERRWAKKL